MDRKNSRKWLKKASSKTVISGLFYFSLSVLLSACIGSGSTVENTAKTPDRTPDWVLNPPRDARYMYGVGSAEKFEDLVQATDSARRQANAAIASQIRVTVSQSNSQRTEVTSGTNQAEQVLTSFASNTRVDTESLSIEQSETIESVVVGNYVYVLQRFDLSRVVSRLHQEIDELDIKIEATAKDVNSNSDVITQWRSMLPALPLIAKRSQSVTMLKLYSKNSVLKAKSPAILAFEKQLAKLLIDLAIQVESQVVKTDSLAHKVRSELTQKGLTSTSETVTNGAETPLKILLHVSSTVETQDDRVYVFLTVNAALQQTFGDGAILANWSLTERGVSAIPSQAQNVAEERIALELANSVFSYLTKETQ